MTKLNVQKEKETEKSNKLRNSKQFDAKGSTIRELTEKESEFAVGGHGGRHIRPCE
jgi:hypothetical protein